ncbi:MAG: fibronectin type III domain-containing protein [Candidatus Levyibacteriota bacterium]
MKKATTQPKKTVKKAPRTTKSKVQPIFLERITIITAAFVITVGAVVFINRHSVTNAVAGASIVQGLFMHAPVAMPNIPDAKLYNIYYKQTDAQDFTNAVRGVSPTIATYTISYLKSGVSYEYRIAAVNSIGEEFYFSDTKPLTGLQPM